MIYVNVCVSLRRKDPFSLGELHNITPLVGLALLHKLSWAMDQQIFTSIRYYSQCLNESIITCL